jgi:hypothetical protein
MDLQIFFLALGGLLAWIPFATLLDSWLYRNGFKKFVERNDPPMNTGQEIFRAFLDVNLFEYGLIASGLIVGYALGVM